MNETSENGLKNRPRLAWATLVTLVSLYVLALFCSAPPPVVSKNADRAQFSAERALELLARIEGSGAPHPIGSSENARVRGEIVAAFATLGLDAAVDERLAVGANGVVAITRNIVARQPGRASTKSVLVCAHHDSVHAGPGTSDDGAGVAAALEIARALQGDPDRQNNVVYLIDDGEEAGLIGARAFLDHSPLAREIGVVVNLEARGTNGRAQMFETSVNNRTLIEALAEGVPHPSASSVAYELYKAMPNDTDLTVFKQAGLAGMNFAFIGGVARYHTPRDDLNHLDLRSLQHLGESALGVTREFVARDLTQLERSGSVYADVLGIGVVHFEKTFMWPLSILALISALASMRGVPVRRFLRAMIALCAGGIVTYAAVLAISSTIEAVHGATYPWSAHPSWSRIAVLLGSFALGSLVVRALAAQTGVRPLDSTAAARSASLVFCAVLGLAATTFVMSASYLFVFPLLAGAVVSALGPRARAWSSLATVAVAAIFTMPLLIGIEDGFGYGTPGAWYLAPLGCVVAACVMLAGSAFVGQSARALALCLPPAALALLVALFVPAFDEDSPTWLNLVHEHDARAGTARWIAVPVAAPMPRELAEAAPFEARANAFEGSLYTGARPGFVAPAAGSRAAAPRLDVIAETKSASKRIVRARLWSPRGALRLLVRTPSGANLRSIARAGASGGGSFVAHETEKLTSGFRTSGSVRFAGIDAAGLVLEFEIGSVGPIDVEILDVSAEMPAEFEALARKRPAHYVPRGEGDASVIHDRVRL